MLFRGLFRINGRISPVRAETHTDTTPTTTSDEAHGAKRSAISVDVNAKIFGALRDGHTAERDLWIARFPIERLPSELLAEAFFWYIATVFEARQRALRQLPRPYCWLVIRHVSRKWRHIALSYPRLSTFICLTRPESVKDMLKRSGNLPLCVSEPAYISATGATDREHQLIFAHLERVETATLTLTLDEDPVPESLQAGVSQLQSLTVNSGVYFTRPGMASTAFFPNFLFPRLQYLSCTGGRFGIYARFFCASLRSLHLLNIGETAEDLFDVLDTLQLLEELVVQQACSGLRNIGESAFPIPRRCVSLPRLQRLDVRQIWADDGMGFLRCLAYPSTTSVILHFKSVSETHAYDSVLTSLTSHITGLSLAPTIVPRSIAAHYGLSHWLSLTLWRERRTLPEMEAHLHTGGAAAFHLTITHAAATWLPHLLRSIAPGDVEAVLLAEQTVGAQPPELLPALARMPRLAELGLAYESFDAARVRERGGAAQMPSDAFVRRAGAAFGALRVLQVRELHHAYSFERVARPSGLKLLAQVLLASKLRQSRGDSEADVGGLSLKDVAMRFERRDFHEGTDCSCGAGLDYPPSPAPSELEYETASQEYERYRRRQARANRCCFGCCIALK